MAICEAKGFGLPLTNLIRLKGVPILHQLNLEEKLLRTSSDNWCIINDGTNKPTIVMGISGKAAEVLEVEPVIRDKVPVIRRFSGGGTVIVDSGTIFVSFICNKNAIPGLQPYPRPIMDWTGLFYGQVFKKFGDFNLFENDYVFGDRKFGGNAQSITKNRWIHHTSFLWDFEPRNMDYLKQPKRAPRYRSSRSHAEFLCCLKEYMPRSVFVDGTVGVASRYHFSVRPGVEGKEATQKSVGFSPSSRLVTEQELLIADRHPHVVDDSFGTVSV